MYKAKQQVDELLAIIGEEGEDISELLNGTTTNQVAENELAIEDVSVKKMNRLQKLLQL